MAEFRKLPTQAELQNMLFMEQMRVKTPQQIAQEALASGTTVTPIPENVFQKIAGGAGIAKEYVNRAGSAADLAKLFPGYKPETRVNIPTGYNFAPKQAPTGEIIPGGLQTQNVNLGQVLQAIKPADVLGISGAERAYSDIGAGKAPQPLDVLDVAGLGATGLVGGKAALRATRSVPVGMSIQEAKGLLTEAPRSPLGFYSALEESALNLQRNKGSGQAFLNDLQKAPNVKADEIKWTGLDEFLKTKPNVTKQEVQDYLANNRVDVEEVKSKVIRPLLSNGARVVMPGDEGAFLPKFGQYTLPGGENYREILLTMPNVKNNYSRLATEVDNRIEQLANEGINLADLPSTDPRRIEIEDLVQKRNAAYVPTTYKSQHFPNENILAHLRVNDRVDADGKKMLLIEEVQSDWHQTGREKGYKGQLTSLPDEYFVSEMTKTNGDVVYEIRKKSNPNVIINRDYNRQSAINGAINTLNETVMGVPDAPFKDSWYQLALKRAIQYAAENGYDRIGLTTGSQQAARFDLSKQIDAIKYNKMPDGRIFWTAEKDGQRVTGGDNAPNELDAVVGKEVAQRIRDGAESGKPGQLTGIDLQVGGEGMKKYYDEIYPKFLDKYGKKWGARVGETSLGGQSLSNADIENKLTFTGSKIKTSDGKFWDDYDDAMRHEGSLTGAPTVRYLDVTPEMKASVSKGQPLFQALPAIPATGLLATQDEER